VRAALTSSAVVAALSIGAAACLTRETVATAGFWYESGACALTADAARSLGGTLTDGEIETIEATSRAEIERAFSGLRVRITDDRRAFWRVEVLQSMPTRRRQLPSAGESVPLGMFGGSGAVAFDLVAAKALEYAPPHAPRGTIVEAIGRGIGRVAVHELAHQILNADAAHNAADENGYEYPSPDRASQYYGELHWTTARPLLERRLR
jgi:hypothetical protein